MKNTFLYSFLLLNILFFACKNTPKPKEEIDITAAAAVETTPGIATIFKVNKQKSTINWAGSSLHGKHNGLISLSSGRVNVVDGNITTGDFDIDMNSLSVLDLKGEEKTELEAHLKENDFFETTKFSAGRFVITKIEKVNGNTNATHQISGDLTLKDITNPISFLANIKITENEIEASSNEFMINRTKWKITYESTLIGVALDKAIKDDIVLKIKLIATK
jgi:polyisoprenoid-binding protein YceI